MHFVAVRCVRRCGPRIAFVALQCETVVALQCVRRCGLRKGLRCCAAFVASEFPRTTTTTLRHARPCGLRVAFVASEHRTAHAAVGCVLRLSHPSAAESRLAGQSFIIVNRDSLWSEVVLRLRVISQLRGACAAVGRNRKPRRCWKKKSGVRARLDSWSWRITPKYIPGLPARFQYSCFSSSKVWLCVCSYLRCSTKTTKFINFNKRLGFETYKCLRKQKAIRFCFGRHTEYTTMTKEV